MNYGYDLNEREQAIIKTCYENILTKVSNYIKSWQNENIFEDFFTCVFLLFDGFFSANHTFIRNNEYEYVSFHNIPYYLYPFNGVGCCRHTNEILFLLFQKLGYEEKCVLCELKVKDEKASEFQKNHIVLMSEIGTQQYFFDLINWNIGKTDNNKISSWRQELSYRFAPNDENINLNDLSFVNLFYEKMHRKLSKDLKNLMLLYKSIQSEMQKIAKILTKYENCASLHIKYLYE